MRVRFMLGLVFLCCLWTACQATKRCPTTLTDAPALRGFRLGMSVVEVQQRFTGFPEISANQNGLALVEMNNGYERTALNKAVGNNTVSLIDARAYPDLKDVKHVELRFVDQKLVRITVFYPSGLNWKSSDEFANNIQENLKLGGAWETLNEGTDTSQRRWLGCIGFSVIAGFDTNIYAFPEITETTSERPKLPFVTLSNALEEIKPEARQLERERNANAQREQRKQVFQP